MRLRFYAMRAYQMLAEVKGEMRQTTFIYRVYITMNFLKLYTKFAVYILHSFSKGRCLIVFYQILKKVSTTKCEESLIYERKRIFIYARER